MIGKFRPHELNVLNVYTLAAEKTVIPKPLENDTSNASIVGRLYM